MLASPPPSSIRVFASFTSSECESAGEQDTEAPRSRGLPHRLEGLPPQPHLLGFAPKQLAIVVVVALVVAMMVVEARIVHQPRVSDSAEADPQRAPLLAASLYSSAGEDTMIIGSLSPVQPPMMPLPDVSCPGGIRSGRVCCDVSCGSCGGANCGDRPGGIARCCSATIRAAAQLCSAHAAPCLVDLEGDALHGARSGAAASDAMILDGTLGDKWGRALDESATVQWKNKRKTLRQRQKRYVGARASRPIATSALSARDSRGFAAPRLDMRCGSKFEHAACVHDSASPCCSVSGWCGRSNKHCSGSGAFDHRNRELCNPLLSNIWCGNANSPRLQHTEAHRSAAATHVAIDEGTEGLVAREGRVETAAHLKRVVAAHLRAYHAKPAAVGEIGQSGKVARLQRRENAIAEAQIMRDIGRAAAASPSS